MKWILPIAVAGVLACTFSLFAWQFPLPEKFPSGVRVPIARAHSESLNLEFENEITPEEAREILKGAEGVKVVDDPLNGGYPMPLDATAKYDVLAGRIRQDISRDDRRGLEMFVSGDQLLRGAALNAVEIAEHLVKRGLV